MTAQNSKSSLQAICEPLESRSYLSTSIAGQQDLAFGELGTVTQTIQAPLDVAARSVAVDKDGSIIVAGDTQFQSPSTIYVARYLRVGVLDAHFGNGGIASLNTPALAGAVQAVLLKPGGRIIVIANTYDGRVLAIALHQDGSPDSQFGTHGIASAIGQALCAVILSDESIMIGGDTLNDRSVQTASYLHLLPDGTIDPLYDGRFRSLNLKGNLTRTPTSFDRMTAQSDGSVIAAGEMGGGILLFKITASGFGTRAFGTDGFTTVNLGAENDAVRGLVQLSDGSLAVLAQSDTQPILARFTAAGRAQLSFGDGGIAIIQLKTLTDDGFNSGEDLVLAPDGDLLVVGSSHELPSDIGQNFVAAFNQRGRLNRGYATGGAAFFGFSVASTLSSAHLAAVTSDGSLIVAGEADIDSRSQFALAKLSANGSLDIGFGQAGTVTTPFAAPTAASDVLLARQEDGKIVAMANLNALVALFFRFNPDGSIDRTFGDQGQFKFQLNESAEQVFPDLAIDSKGRILGMLSGEISGENAARIFRLTSQGRLDTTFAINGILTPQLGGDSQPLALATQGNRLIFAGQTDSKLEIRRFDEAGTLDTSFGQAGETDVEIPAIGASRLNAAVRLSIAPDGAIFVAHQATEFLADRIHLPVQVAKLLAGGAVDRSFGVNGIADADLGTHGSPYSASTLSIARLPNGQVAVAGWGDDQWTVAMFRTNGQLDPSFGKAGIAHAPFGPPSSLAPTAILQASGGGLFLAGSDGGYYFGKGRLVVIRLTSAGKLDPAYGSGGISQTFDDDYNAAGGAVVQPDGKVVVAGTAGLQLVRFLGDNDPAITAKVDAGVLKIAGTSGPDRIVLRRVVNGIQVLSIPTTFPTNSFSRIEISGGAGDDFIDASQAPVPLFTTGGDGNDILLGGSAADSLAGGGGNDTVFGGSANDTLHGNQGNDYLNGGPGNDNVFGDAGNDQIFAQDNETDTIDGGPGYDRLKSDPQDLQLQIEEILK